MESEGSRPETEFECPTCGYDGVCVRGGRPTCPRCGESFTAHVAEEFVLVEHDGWTVTLSVSSRSRETQSDSTA